MKTEVNSQLLELQQKFREYYDKNLGRKFVELEQKRKECLRCFVVRLLFYILIWVAFVADVYYNKGFFIYPMLTVGTFLAVYLQNYGNHRMAYKWPFIFSLVYIIIYDFCFFGQNDEVFVKEWLGNVAISIYVLTVIVRVFFIIDNYKEETKSKVMQKVLDFFGTFVYSYGARLPEELLKKSQMFAVFNQHYGDDYFFGSYQGVKIQVAEEEIVWNGRRYSFTIFKGIIIELDMNKKFKGQTVVLKDSWFRLFKPKYRKSRKNKALERVKLEDIGFERKFDVYSSNQVEARYILTPVFMEKIEKLKKLYHGHKVQLSFFDNKVLIAISCCRDILETTSLFFTIRYGKISNVVSQLYCIFEIINILQLNKKILL